MFRCFLRPRGRSSIPTTSLPSFASSGSRGIKLARVSPAATTSKYICVPLLTSGRAWLNKLASSDIGHHGELETVRSLGSHNHFKITIRVAPRHVRKFTDDVYFSESGHPIAEAVVRRYLRDHQEKPLWTITSVRTAEKAIVRGKFKYRANAAFHQALANAGYDTAGRRMAGSQEGGRNGAVAQLFGTVEILTAAPKEAQMAPFTKLREFFEKAVEVLEQRLGRTADGRGTVTPRVQAQVQRPQHQAHGRSIKRTDGRSSGYGGPDASRRGALHGPVESTRPTLRR